MERKSLKDRIKPIVYPIINFIPRRRLKNKNFTIICISSSMIMMPALMS